LAKPLPFDKTFIYFLINLKTIFSTKYFNKTFWLFYWPSYLVGLITLLTKHVFYLCTYLPTKQPTYLLTYLLTYLPTYLPTDLLTYLPIIYIMLMFANVWCTKHEGIALNEVTSFLIIYDPLMSINNNPECRYCNLINFCDPHVSIAYFSCYYYKLK
jgi:hypothetical protein